MTYESVLAEAGAHHRELISAFCEKNRGRRCLVSSFEVTKKYWGWVTSVALEGDELKLQAEALDWRFPPLWESTISLEDNMALFREHDDGSLGIVGRNPHNDGRYTEWKFTFSSSPASS